MIRISAARAHDDYLAPVVQIHQPHHAHQVSSNGQQTPRNVPSLTLVNLDVPGQDAGEFSASLARHLRELERVHGLRPRSIEERRNAVRRANDWLRAHRNTDLLHATRADLEEWQLEQSGEHAHRNNMTGHVKAFCAWAQEKEYLAVDPAATLHRGKGHSRRKPRLPDDDVVNRAFDLTRDTRILTGLVLATCCGLRASEIARLRIEDLHLDGTAPWLMVWDGKGGVDRRVPIPVPIVPLLRRLLPAGEWVFERRDGHGGPVDPNTVTTVINTYLHEVVGTTRTLHGMRHWYATRSYEMDQNLISLQQRLGHADISTTVIYVTLVDDEQSRPTIDHLGDLLPGLATVHDLDERRRRRRQGGGSGHGGDTRRADRPIPSVADPFPKANRDLDAVSCHQLPSHGHHDRIR